MSHLPEPTTLDHEDLDVAPGTIHLVDAQGNLHSKHASGSDKDIVLVPAPSSSPDDPLNWSQRRKLLSAFCMSVYVLVIGICSSSLYSILDPFSRATGLSPNDLNSGTGYMFLFFGFGCIFWQALAVQFGKRPVYLISTAATLGIMVWQPYIRSNGAWIAAKILQGAFGAPIESLAEITISDVFFTHERGKYIALYALALGYSNGIAPLITGFINDSQGFEWVFYWCAIFCAIVLVILLLFMEETKFVRAEYIETYGSQLEPSSAYTENPTDLEAVKAPAGDIKTNETGTTPPRQSTTQPGQAYITNMGAKKSHIKRLKLVENQNFRGEYHLGRLMVRPVILLIFPLISYAGFIYGANFVWLAVLNAIESIVFSAEPYGFSTSVIGLTFIAPLVGTTFACIFTGIVGDRFIIQMARRNNGYMEAEHRLWLFVPSLILVPFGCFLFGIGAFHNLHWFALVVAMAVISFTSTAGAQIGIAYCIDCYRELGGEALATVIIIRNLMAFAVGYGVTPWFTNMGYQNGFILAGVLGVVHNLSIFPVMKWGRALRQKSSNRYWAYVQEGRSMNLNH